jgi:hypothetical protein
MVTHCAIKGTSRGPEQSISSFCPTSSSPSRFDSSHRSKRTTSVIGSSMSRRDRFSSTRTKMRSLMPETRSPLYTRSKIHSASFRHSCPSDDGGSLVRKSPNCCCTRSGRSVSRISSSLVVRKYRSISSGAYVSLSFWTFRRSFASKSSSSSLEPRSSWASPIYGQTRCEPRPE